MSKALTKKAVLNDLVALEQFLAKLREDFEAATYRRNETIEAYLEKASEELESGFRALSRENVRKAHKSLRICWIEANYARQLFDAETVEHVLGEGEYLELSEAQGDWRSHVANEFNFLEQELRALRVDIKRREAGELE